MHGGAVKPFAVGDSEVTFGRCASRLRMTRAHPWQLLYL